MNVKCYFKFSERGRRNDLHPQNNIHLTPAQDSSDVSHTLPKLSDQNGRSVNANESVHNHHSINGESCHSHSCVEPVTHFDSGGVISKLRKQQNLLTEVIVPTAIKQNLLSESDIEKEIVVVDGGDNGNPSIRPPNGLTWLCLDTVVVTSLNRKCKNGTERYAVAVCT